MRLALSFLTSILKLAKGLEMATIRVAPVLQKSPVSCENPKTGTELANYTSILSCVTVSDRAIVHRWGGARNSAARTSSALNKMQVELLIGAARCAAMKAMPLNRHITIHWGKLGLADSEAAQSTSRFIKYMRDALAKAGAPFAAIWVRENGRHEGGSHVHILAHIPFDCITLLVRLQCGWVSRAAGRPYRAKALRGKRIAGAGRNAGLYQANFNAVQNYLAKGASADAAQVFGLTHLRPGGTIIGKRCGTTQNIGRATWPIGLME